MEGSYAIGLEHEEFLARVSAWVDETTGARPRRVVVPSRSPGRSAAVVGTICALALIAAIAATPLDAATRGWSLGLAPFGAGVAVGLIAQRLGSRRPALAAAAGAALCFAAMLAAVVAATVRA